MCRVLVHRAHTIESIFLKPLKSVNHHTCRGHSAARRESPAGGPLEPHLTLPNRVLVERACTEAVKKQRFKALSKNFVVYYSVSLILTFFLSGNIGKINETL